MFTWDFVSAKIEIFSIRCVWSISCNCLHEIPPNDTNWVLLHCSHLERNDISFRVIKCYANNTPKWKERRHLKGNIFACEYFIKIKMVENLFIRNLIPHKSYVSVCFRVHISRSCLFGFYHRVKKSTFLTKLLKVKQTCYSNCCCGIAIKIALCQRNRICVFKCTL